MMQLMYSLGELISQEGFSQSSTHNLSEMDTETKPVKRVRFVGSLLPR